MFERVGEDISEGGKNWNPIIKVFFFTNWCTIG